MHRSLCARLGRPSSIVAVLTLAVASIGCGSSTGDDTGFTDTDGGSGSSKDGGPGHQGGGDDAGGGGNAGDDGSTPPPPDGVVAVPLMACVPLVYAAEVTVGTQQFGAIVDTGSTSLGIAGTGCSNCSVSPLYTPGSSAVDQKQKAQSQFGSGSWSGEIFEDSVATAPAEAVPVKLVSITSQSGFFQKGSTCGGKPYQGLMGLSFAASAVQGTNGFFDQYVKAKGVPDVFAMQLCDDGGTMWLGGYDPAATTGAPQYVPYAAGIASSLYYAINLQSITVNGTTVPIASGQNTDSLVDTGTSVFLFDSSTTLNKLTAAIQASDGFKQVIGSSAGQWFSQTQPGCAALSQTKAQIDAALPPMTLTFAGGATVQAPATESYIMPYGNQGWCNALFAQSVGAPVATIMGAPILRSSVVIWDRAQKRIGFAPHKACPSARVHAAPGAMASVPGLAPRINHPTFGR